MTTVVSLTFSALALAGSDDPIQQRHDLMEDTRDALKPMVKMVRGEMEFDAGVVEQGLQTMQHTANTAGDLFPPGSETGGDTEAKSTIWTDRAGFEQALNDYAVAVEAAISAAPQSAEELKGVLGGITKTCKGCHDGYRVEKE
jgi:cytochrome c556